MLAAVGTSQEEGCLTTGPVTLAPQSRAGALGAAAIGLWGVGEGVSPKASELQTGAWPGPRTAN